MRASGLRARLPLSTRADAVELLESGRLRPDDVERNLADLARMNRLPGGTAASLTAIRQLVGPDGDVRVLDVGTGRGDMPIAFARRGWRTVAIDTNPDVLRVARRVVAGRHEIELVEADGRALPFEDGAFEVAHCSLLVHHLSPAEAVAALREMRRVARHGVVINDLRRGILPLIATTLTVLAFGRSAVTRNDGIVSARRAYTVAELDGLLREAGLIRRWRSPAWLPRVVTAAVPS
jgi:SAM-dependent methyltransferase